MGIWQQTFLTWWYQILRSIQLENCQINHVREHLGRVGCLMLHFCLEKEETHWLPCQSFLPEKLKLQILELPTVPGSSALLTEAN